MRLYRILVMYFSLIFFFLNPLFAYQCPEYKKTYEQIQARQQQALIPCDDVVKKLKELNIAFRDYATGAMGLDTFCRQAMARINKILQPLIELRMKQKQLMMEAANNHLLIDKEVLERMPAIANGQRDLEKLRKAGILKKGEDVMFGVPTSAMTFKTKEIALLREFRKKEAEIFFKYQKEAPIVEEKLKKAVDEINKEINSRLKKIGEAINKYNSLKKEIKRLFESKAYIHCLGEPVQGEVTIKDSINPLTSEKEIPGMDNLVLSLEEIKKDYHPFKLGKIPPLPQIPFLKDGTFYAKMWAGVVRDRKISEQMDNIIKFTQTAKSLCEIAVDLDKTIFVDVPKGIINMPRDLVGSAKDMFVAIGEGDYEKYKQARSKFWHTVGAPFILLKDLANRIRKDVSNIHPVEFGSALTRLASSSEELENSIATFMATDYKYGDPLFDPDYPRNGTAEDYLNYIKRTQKRIALLHRINKDLDTIEKNTRATADGLAAWAELYILKPHRAAAEMVVGGGKFFFRNLRGAKFFAKKYANRAYWEHKINIRKAQTELAHNTIDLFNQRNYTKAKEKIYKHEVPPELTEKPKVGEKGGKSKQKPETNDLVDEAINQLEELDQLENALEEQVEAKIDTGPIGKVHELIAKNKETALKETVQQIMKKDPLGKGTIKKVYDAGEKEVLQVITKEDKFNSFANEKNGAKLLKEAGLECVETSDFKVIEIKDEFGFPQKVAVRVAEKINSEYIGENIIKSGKWSSEHARAIARALKQANVNRILFLDPNLGNIIFKKTGDSLKAVFLETDGVIDVTKLRNKKIRVRGKEFDLSTVEGIEKLQKEIVYGHSELQNLTGSDFNFERNMLAQEVIQRFEEDPGAREQLPGGVPVGATCFNENFVTRAVLNETLRKKFKEKYPHRKMDFEDWIDEHPQEYKELLKEVKEEYHLNNLTNTLEKYYDQTKAPKVRDLDTHIQKAKKTANRIEEQALNLEEQSENLNLAENSEEDFIKFDDEFDEELLKANIGEEAPLEGKQHPIIEFDDASFEEFLKRNIGELPGEID